jgi:aminoglycoside 6'-N-acetyltransferase I
MSDAHVRPAKPADCFELSKLLHALWPESSADEHARELEAILAGDAPGILPLVIFVAEANDKSLLGFLEVGLRSRADGCDPAQPVGYVEGWHVVEQQRRRGIGRHLLAAAEQWARSHGCVEMASDAQIDNTLSQRVHQSVGFETVERAALFRKSLR